MSDHDFRAMEWRGIELGNECQVCLGTGVRWYNNSSAWRGGMGASKSTRELCDSCWGSGDRTRAFHDLRKLTQEAERRSSQNAVRELVRGFVGSSPRGAASASLALLVTILEGVGNGRYAAREIAKAGFGGTTAASLALALARMLREGSVEEPPQKTPMFPPRLRYADPERAHDFELVVEKDTWPYGDDDDDGV